MRFIVNEIQWPCQSYRVKFILDISWVFKSIEQPHPRLFSLGGKGEEPFSLKKLKERGRGW